MQTEQQTEQRVDPFTIEVVKDALTAVGDEMFETLLRTSMSPIIYEVLDFASGLTDASGRLITQGQGVTGFIGMLTTSVEAVLEKWEGRLEPTEREWATAARSLLLFYIYGARPAR